MDCFRQNFKWVFEPVFSTLLSVYLHLFQSQILSFKRRVYQEFSKVISCVFHHKFNPYFSHTYLSFPLIYPFYRRVVVRVILGDQSVVITKVPILVLRRRTCGFAVFRVLVRALCRGAASANLRACGVLFLREQERDQRVQEFQWELLVGVAAPSDPVGSILVEILHSVEDGDVEQVCSNLEIILPCL